MTFLFVNSYSFTWSLVYNRVQTFCLCIPQSCRRSGCQVNQTHWFSHVDLWRWGKAVLLENMLCAIQGEAGQWTITGSVQSMWNLSSEATTFSCNELNARIFMKVTWKWIFKLISCVILTIIIHYLIIKSIWLKKKSHNNFPGKEAGTLKHMTENVSLPN